MSDDLRDNITELRTRQSILERDFQEHRKEATRLFERLSDKFESAVHDMSTTHATLADKIDKRIGELEQQVNRMTVKVAGLLSMAVIIVEVVIRFVIT